MRPHRPPHPRTSLASWLAAVGAPTAASAIALWLEPHWSVAGLSMLYLLAVVLAAVWLPRAPAAAAALASVGALNWLFVPPRRSFAVQAAEGWWLLAVLLTTALGLQLVMAQLQRERSEARAAQERALQARALMQQLAACDGPQAVTQALVDTLAGLAGTPAAVFMREGRVAGAALVRQASDDRTAFDAEAARWVIDTGRPAGRGCPDWPDLALWCAPFARRGHGALQLAWPAAAAPDPATAAHWQDLVRLGGAAIEREHAAVQAREAGQAARAEAARNTLLASLSHDLRTPLAALVGSASALRAQGQAMPPAQRERLLAALEDEALDLAAMAENVLQAARLAQPEASPRMDWESLADVLGAAVSRMRRRWPAASIQLRCPHDLPPVRVEAALLAQAVANLVDNAARHGGPQARIVVQAGRSRDGLFVAVRDHGPGLPPGDAATLFERWQAGTTNAGGTGLGLAIVRLAAQAHGGRVSARNAEPGAEFRIDLPLQPAPAEIAE